MQEYVEKSLNKVDDATDQVVQTDMALKDVRDDWNENMEEINDHIKESALKNGINKKDYYKNYQFKEFNINKAVPRNRCNDCLAGRECKFHPFQRNQQAQNFAK